jgi:hypothetical protein
MVTEVLLPTGFVLTVNVAVVAPPTAVTLEGTVAAAVLLLLSVTTAPPAAAGSFSVTVPADEVPPTTGVGLTLAELTTGASTVSPALCVPLKVAETVTVVLLATGLVLIVNVAVVAPPATVTLAGTVAAAVLLLLSVTTAPPAGATALSVTVPVDEAPPVTVLGLRVTELTTGAFTPSDAVLVTLLEVAEIVTAVLVATGLVLIVKATVVAPAATVTLAGTVAAAVLLLLSVTTAPPVAAAPFRVTVPVDEAPPVTDPGLKPRELGAGALTVRVAVAVVL